MSLRNIIVSSLTFFFWLIQPWLSEPNELRAEAVASREAVKEAVKEKREEIRTAAKERWEELKNTREATREAKRAEIKESAQTKKEEVKAKVTAMRDERKKQIVERVQERLGAVNTNRTDHFQKVLDRLSTVLDKVVSRSEKLKAEGKNTANIEAAVTTARLAITTAESAVVTQKGKTYKVTVTDDTTAKNDVGATVKQLQTDLQSVQVVVKAARDAVENVYQVMKTVVGVKTEASPSAVTP